MRFIYRWKSSEEVREHMPDVLFNKLTAVELASPLNVPSLESDYAYVWWIPQSDADQFRYTHEYAEAKHRYGQVFEYKALIEHSGQTWSGYFFVVYEQQQAQAA